MPDTAPVTLEQAQGEERADRSQHKEEAVDHEAAIAVEHRHGGEEPNRDETVRGAAKTKRVREMKPKTYRTMIPATV